MISNNFIHSDNLSPTTLSEIGRVCGWVAPNDFLGAFAYATQSGVASFELEFGDAFWANTSSRWLFGIDYGRTQPEALRRLSQQENSEIRVVDGAWVLEQAGFVPRRDFHAKLSLISNSVDVRYGMVVGSGNFSSNGLRKSVEAGASFLCANENDYNETLAASVAIAQSLWDEATPLDSVLTIYEERWAESFAGNAHVDQEDGGEIDGPEDLFWIEAGYVTKNRGPNAAGNQIDLPRGMSRYFGFDPDDNLPVNSTIGEVTFLTPVGISVTRNIRLGNNHMEKITLPIPETHGIDIYDGKIIVFQRSVAGFLIRALEFDDFGKAFGERLSAVRVMGSGRRYGHIE